LLEPLRFFAIILVICLTVSVGGAQTNRLPNVLFIGVDDLRPEMNCYGVEKMRTPHLDQLCRQGVRFDRAYCNVAVCGASRASIMKGLRPTPYRFATWHCWAEKDAPDVPSLPMVFKRQGYQTVTIGKIYRKRTPAP
jgi:arylsulfatase A-like enzyme